MDPTLRLTQTSINDMKRLLKDLMTEEDNKTYDTFRVITLLSFFLVAFIAIYSLVVKGEVIDTLAELLLAIFGGGGGAIAAKGKFERPSQGHGEEDA